MYFIRNDIKLFGAVLTKFTLSSRKAPVYQKDLGDPKLELKRKNQSSRLTTFFFLSPVKFKQSW